MTKNPAILVIDDDEGICRLIEKSLRGMGHTVKYAHSGKNALELCRAEGDSLLLLDYRLPDMTGKEVITTLFGEGIRIPFIIITGQGDEKIAVEMMKLGAADYITKDASFLDVLPSVVERSVRQIRTENRLVASEEALRESEVRAVAFMNAFPKPAFIGNLDRTALIANSNSIEAGLDVGGKCYEALFNFNEICPWCLAVDAVETGEPRQDIIEHDGAFLEINWVPVDGQSYLHYTFDITERIRSENEKRELEKQIQHAQKLESLGVLAGGIAHDFNNLLVGILGNASIAAMKAGESSPSLDAIAKVETAARRAAELTNQMLAYSGKGRFVVEPLDLNSLVEEMGHLLQAAVAKNALVRYNLSKGIPTVEADSSQIRQVVMNLITNASDAVEETSGVVTVTTGCRECDKSYLTDTLLDDELESGQYVFLEVSDTGCGMTNEVQERIFDPFFSTKPMGRGLGMAAVLGIVRGHRGAIKIYSEPGKGTTFKVLLPASDKRTKETEKVSWSSDQWRSEATVLVIDDEESVRDIASMVLSELGIRVLLAPDGREGLDVFEKNQDQIDLVILDLTMPHMGGIEVFDRMKAISQDVKIIFSSGFSKDEATGQLSGKGLSGFIQKPYMPADLTKIVRETLEG